MHPDAARPRPADPARGRGRRVRPRPHRPGPLRSLRRRRLKSGTGRGAPPGIGSAAGQGRPKRAVRGRKGPEDPVRLSRAGISLPPAMGGTLTGGRTFRHRPKGVGRGSECRRGMRSSCPGRIGQGVVAALTGGIRFCAECTNPAPLLASVLNRPGPGSAPSGRAGCGAEPHVWRLVVVLLVCSGLAAVPGRVASLC